MNIPHLLTKSLKTPLYKGVLRGEVCPRYLTHTSLDDSWKRNLDRGDWAERGI